MRFEVKHSTSYSYSESVSQCHNLAYILPRQTRRQTCLSSEIIIDPMPSSVVERVDYFGNRAYHFTVQEPHNELIVTAKSSLEVNEFPDWPTLDLGNTCQQAKQLLHQSTNFETLLAREFVLASPLIQFIDGIHDYALPIFQPERPFLSAVKELTEKNI